MKNSTSRKILAAVQTHLRACAIDKKCAIESSKTSASP
jgi:hypothetical protein